MMLIRPYQAGDESDVVALWRACELVKPWNDPHKDISRKLAVNPELFLVGVLNPHPLGLAPHADASVVATAMFGYEGHRGWVNYLAVRPDHQRLGMAAAIMQAGEALLLALGCPKINLQVRSTNTGVIAMYAKLGYTEDAAVSLGKRLIAD